MLYDLDFVRAMGISFPWLKLPVGKQYNNFRIISLLWITAIARSTGGFS
jgi:hypothetical protein